MSTETDTGTEGLSEETLHMAAVGRGEADPAPAAPAVDDKPQRPDNVPEKFWDAEKGEVRQDALLQSYLELEKGRGPKEEPKQAPNGQIAPKDEPEGGDKPDETDDNPAPGVIPQGLFEAARTEWDASGELGDETRTKILAAGVPEETLDLYLAGVKALSEKLVGEIHEVAGGEEAYAAAQEWARDNWTQAQIDKFNSSLADPDLRDLAVKGLMAASAVEDGEGRLTLPGSGGDSGDFYTDKDEFLQDLAKADKDNDPVARKKAVAKLDRSKKANKIGHVTPRTGLAQFA